MAVFVWDFFEFLSQLAPDTRPLCLLKKIYNTKRSRDKQSESVNVRPKWVVNTHLFLSFSRSWVANTQLSYYFEFLSFFLSFFLGWQKPKYYLSVQLGGDDPINSLGPETQARLTVADLDYGRPASG